MGDLIFTQKFEIVVFKTNTTCRSKFSARVGTILLNPAYNPISIIRSNLTEIPHFPIFTCDNTPLHPPSILAEWLATVSLLPPSRRTKAEIWPKPRKFDTCSLHFSFLARVRPQRILGGSFYGFKPNHPSNVIMYAANCHSFHSLTKRIFEVLAQRNSLFSQSTAAPSERAL